MTKTGGVTFSDWSRYVLRCAIDGREGMTAQDHLIAHSFVLGRFDYRTGEPKPNSHQTLTIIAANAGCSPSSAKRFIQRAKAVGAIAEVPGSARYFSNGDGALVRPTPLYRLTIPAKARATPKPAKAAGDDYAQWLRIKDAPGAPSFPDYLAARSRGL